MKTKNLFFTIALVLMALLLLTSAVAAQEEADLVRLTIDNRTDQTVALGLTGVEEGAAYYLVVGAGTERVFTVVRDEYTQTTVACGLSATGTVDITRQLFLNFTSCFGPPANQGEPGMEKIFLTESPTKTPWQFQYD